MAEPTISLQVNTGSEGTPSWVTIDTAVRFTGPGGVGDPFPAPIGDGDDAFFDADSAPDDGEFWHDTTTDLQCTVAGRNGNQNVLQAIETGTSDGTATAPEFTAYDDSTDGENRTNPAVWLLTGTSGTSNISCVRAVETTDGAGSVGGWQAQIHDEDPQTTGTASDDDGFALDGNKAGEKVVTAAVLAASGTKQFAVAVCAPHDATAGLTAFVFQLQYTYV